MGKDEFEDIQRLLKRSGNASARDRNTFTNWGVGLITTQKAFEEFCENNDVSFDYWKERIKLSVFDRWMMSLGYRHGL